MSSHNTVNYKDCICGFMHMQLNAAAFMRLCFAWQNKQWRYVRTRVRNLLKMETHRNVAIPMSFSRKGPWKCARTLATQTGMTIQWLKDQGLLSVKELWVNIHYPTTVR